MKIIVSGANGQLGKALLEVKPKNINLITCPRQKLDICNIEKSRDLIREIKPDLIINAAAYTAVEKAEDEFESAYSINADGVQNIARIALEENIELIHISTDYVFDGTLDRPYKESDQTNPLNIYGKSKLKGEQLASEVLGDKLLILRTAWLYSFHGPSFLKTITNLLFKKESINVVDNQFGSPTRTKSLAQAIYHSIDYGVQGIYHFTDLGDTSWFGFASAIREILIERNPSVKIGQIHPVSSKDFPSKILRPRYTVLDKRKIRNHFKEDHIHWRDALEMEITYG